MLGERQGQRRHCPSSLGRVRRLLKTLTREAGLLAVPLSRGPQPRGAAQAWAGETQPWQVQAEHGDQVMGGRSLGARTKMPAPPADGAAGSLGPSPWSLCPSLCPSLCAQPGCGARSPEREPEQRLLARVALGRWGEPRYRPGFVRFPYL